MAKGTKLTAVGTPNTLVVSTILFFALTLFLQKTQREDVSASELCVFFGTIHRPVKSRV